MREPDEHKTDQGPRRQLSLLDSTCIIVGIIIGAGFVESTPLIAASAGSPRWLLAAWVLGGVIALAGAMCYAELATAYPRDGGDYVFLSRAYGKPMGFLFAWTEYLIIRPGNVGAMAFVYARYASRVVPLNLASWLEALVHAGTAVLVLTTINILGVRASKWTQNLLTITKVVGLLGTFVVAVFSIQMAPASPPVGGRPGNFELAMILVLFAYGGWGEMSYVAEEVRQPRRNIWRALLLGTGAVMLLYILGSLSFVGALGFERVTASKAVAAEVMSIRLGDAGAKAVSVLICLTCLGAIQGMLFTGSRVAYAAGADHRILRWMAKWNTRLDSPARSLVVQGAITLALTVVFSRTARGFEGLVIFTSPPFWAFLLLVAIALIVLRRTDADVVRTYRVPGYPLTPLLFVGACAFMLYASTRYARQNMGWEVWWLAAVAGSGLALTLIAALRGR